MRSMRPTALAAVVTAVSVLLADATGIAAPRRPAAEPLPVVRIDADRPIRDEPKTRARVRVTMRAGTRLRTVYSGWAGIEIRGNTSQQWPKKSYAVELRTAGGTDREVPLLGMPADDDWVLYAAYGDASLIRNAVGYDLARWTGRWTPATRFVEVVLNGRFHGVYALTERIELSRERLHVPGRDLTGPYLLELTSARQAPRKPHVLGPVTRVPLAYVEPDARDLTGSQRRYLREYVGRIERALYHGAEDWRAVLDERAAIDHVLIQELFRNIDAFRASTYMVKPPGRSLELGPVWDLDLALGNYPRRASGVVTGSTMTARPWSMRLLDDPTFRAGLATRWRELRARGLFAALTAAVDRHVATLTAAGIVRREFRRWPRPWPLPAARRTHADEIRYLRAWLVARVAWMDATYAGAPG